MSIQLFPQGKTLGAAGKAVLLLVVCLLAGVVLIAGLSKLGFHFDPFGLGKRRLDRAENTAVVETAKAAVAQAQADVGVHALRAYDAAQLKNQATRQIRTENRDAILSTPGADAPIDPGLSRRFDDGLCRYEAYAADPGCAGLPALPRAAAPADAGDPPAGG